MAEKVNKIRNADLETAANGFVMVRPPQPCVRPADEFRGTTRFTGLHYLDSTPWDLVVPIPLWGGRGGGMENIYGKPVLRVVRSESFRFRRSRSLRVRPRQPPAGG